MSADLRLVKRPLRAVGDAARGVARANRVPADLCVVAEIDNHRQLERAYGSAIALTVRHLVRERARLLCDDVGGLTGDAGPRLLLVLDGAATKALDEAGKSIVLERIIAALGGQGVEFTWGTIFPVISARFARPDESPFDIDDVESPRSAAMAGAVPPRAPYATDMAIAAAALAALEDGDLRLDYQPICHTDDMTNVLYHEALLRKVVGHEYEYPGAFIPALERTGLVRRIDQWVVEAVINRLHAHPDIRLGCNISAFSAVIDGWWASILAKLRAAPDVASRLTIEITETAPLSALDAATHFVQTLQSIGCHVALDDVGVGYSNIETLVALRPDVVKIDAVYVRRARSVATGQHCLTHLVGLASSCASRVVIEGIESERDLDAARSSGAAWVQGYLPSQLSTQACV